MAPNEKSKKNASTKVNKEIEKDLSRPKRTYKRKQPSNLDKIPEEPLVNEVIMMPMNEEPIRGNLDKNFESNISLIRDSEPLIPNVKENQNQNSDLIQTIHNIVNKLNEKEGSPITSFEEDNMEDIRSCKKEERENLNFLLKNLPKFTGGVKEDFEAWESTARLLLDEHPLVSSKKRFALLVCIQGDARKAIDMDTLSTPESIILGLRQVFGSKLKKIVQKPNEPVRLYYTRLTKSLVLDRRDLTSEEREDFLLDLFIEGLLPQFSERLRQLTPDSLRIAVRAVEKWEIQANNNSEQINANTKMSFVNSDWTMSFRGLSLLRKDADKTLHY